MTGSRLLSLEQGSGRDDLRRQEPCRPDERGPHLTLDESRRLVAELEGARAQDRRELMTRLAWRPAWAIRSRRGTLSVLRDLWRQLRGHDS